MAVNGFQSMWSDIVASRFELLLFAVSLIGYFLVVASRRSQKSEKNISCKADFAVEVSQVDAPKDQDSTDQEGYQIPEACDHSGTDVQSDVAELLDSGQDEKACDVFEMNYSAFFDMDIDEDLECRLLTASLKCGRQSLADHLLATSQTDFEKHVTTIQRRWRRSAAKMSDSRLTHMHDVLDRMAQMFNDLHPFEERSEDGESTCVLGDGRDSEDENIGDSDWDDTASIMTEQGDWDDRTDLDVW